MDDVALLALFAAAAINAVIPGPGMLLAIGRSAAVGFGAGLRITVGMLLAALLLLVMTCGRSCSALSRCRSHCSTACGSSASGSWR